MLGKHCRNLECGRMYDAFHITYSYGNNEYFSTFMAMSLHFHIHSFFHNLEKCKTLLWKHGGKLNVEEYIYIFFHFKYLCDVE